MAFFFFKQKTAYELRISDWSSDVCSSDLGIEWQLAVDRAEAAKYGVDVTTVGSSVQLITKGLKFGDFRPDDADDEIDIVARYPSASSSEERRVGKECVSTFRSGWAAYH